MQIILTPELLLSAYSQGIFPMAENAETQYVHWVCPEMRGQLSVQDMHVPKRLKRTVRQMKISGVPYEIRINAGFEDVIRACAQETDGRQETWINDNIVEAYCALHEQGHAHSVECWQEGELCGGLYGITIGGAFFGESMFSRKRDASKVSLVHLAARLHHAGYEVLDTQFTNEHLEQFGVYEIEHTDYLSRLEPVLEKNCVFDPIDKTEKQLITDYFS
ncbi:MAG: leucyl/phenylalanyl-tRNA--protein transferase [Alphaproteobacteria bacterium]